MYCVIHNKHDSTGKLLNTADNGLLFRGNCPKSDFFEITNSTIRGYLGHIGIVSKVSSLNNLIANLDNFISDKSMLKSEKANLNKLL